MDLPGRQGRIRRIICSKNININRKGSDRMTQLRGKQIERLTVKFIDAEKISKGSEIAELINDVIELKADINAEIGGGFDVQARNQAFIIKQEVAVND